MLMLRVLCNAILVIFVSAYTGQVLIAQSVVTNVLPIPFVNLTDQECVTNILHQIENAVHQHDTKSLQGLFDTFCSRSEDGLPPGHKEKIQRFQFVTTQ